MAGLGSLSIKQVRQAGFNGPIMVPLPPARGETEEVVPKEYLTKIVIDYYDVDSPIVTEAYRDVYYKAKEKFSKTLKPRYFSHITR